jgi:GNAT superfamily N-acetyltransferase
MSLLLRPATPEDASHVAQILIDTRATFMPYAPSAHTEHELRAWVAGHLVPGGGVTVAEQAGAVVALMAVEQADGIAWITQMAVTPSLVARGIGRRLLDQAIATLPTPIRLCTFQANAGARRFYERHGFRPIRFTDGQDNEEHCPDVLYERADTGAVCRYR